MLSLILASLLAYAQPQSQQECTVYSAQFIGDVVLHEVTHKDDQTVCVFSVRPVMFNPAYMCPLDLGEATYAQFLDSSCARNNGDRISGVMYKRNGFIYIE